MSAFAKVGLLLLGVAAMGTGTWYLSGDQMPTFTVLNVDNDFKGESTKSGYTGKYGSSYSRFFIGFTSSENDSWWDWALKNRYPEDQTKVLSKKFKKTEHTNKNPLKEGCKLAYKAETSKVKTSNPDSSKEEEFSESEIWKFCSPQEKKPVTLTSEEKTKYNGKMGGDATNSEKYISVTDPSNFWFWQLKQEEFFDGDTNNTNSGSKATSDSFFKKYYDAGKSQKTTLKEKCQEAYGMATPNGTGSPTSEDVLKYCALKA